MYDPNYIKFNMCRVKGGNEEEGKKRGRGREEGVKGEKREEEAEREVGLGTGMPT